MIEYRKASLQEQDIIDQLIQLSIDWENENVTGGYRKNTVEDIKEPIFVATECGKVVGYTFGELYKRKTDLGEMKEGDEAFDVLEIYVVPAYRSQGIGKTLLKLIEEEASKYVEYLTLATSTKDYKKILKFYIEDCNLDWHSALFTKKLK